MNENRSVQRAPANRRPEGGRRNGPRRAAPRAWLPNSAMESVVVARLASLASPLRGSSPVVRRAGLMPGWTDRMREPPSAMRGAQAAVPDRPVDVIAVLVLC